jgi:dimethylhistidine N-methyltransferase
MGASMRVIDLHPRQTDFRQEVLHGLHKPQKELPAKFFYDQRGSELFEEITTLPEYYLTRAEISILDGNAEEILRMMGEEFALIEFGSGSSRKVRILLDQRRGRTTYMPVDISLVYLKESAELLHSEYPDIEVVALCADYTLPFEIPAAGGHEKRVVFFPGSTVGNLEPHLATVFFRDTAGALQPGDGMLIGVDLKKDAAILHAAYNDSRGVTAEFNFNILRHINRRLGPLFEPSLFEHIAFYNPAVGRIEMHLRALRSHTVEIGGETIRFRQGETIHTENSYKYEITEFHALLHGTGFAPVKVWTDPDRLFSVHYLEVADTSGPTVRRDAPG